MSKKNKIIIITLCLGIVACWTALSFLVEEKMVSRLSLWANLIVGTGTIITSLIALFISVVAFNKTEQMRKQKLEEDANRFINDNSGEIEYIPLCLVANAYDNHHKYNRKIYNAFNVINVDLQKEILKQLHYDYQIIKGNQWIDNGIDVVRRFVDENDLGDDFLYDGGKYFHRSLDYSTEMYDNTIEYAHILPDIFNWNPKIFFKEDKAYQENVTLYDYVDSFLTAKNNNDPLFSINKDKKPLTLLSLKYNFGSCDEKELCKWIMLVVETIVLYIIKNRKNTDDYYHLSKSDSEIMNYEDRYLEVLMELYNLSFITAK